MSNNKNEKNESKKNTAIAPQTTGNLFSFDEFDNFFDGFLARRWPRLVDWNFPSGLENNIPKVDIIEHDNEIEVQAALPGVKKEDLDVSINNHSITIHASTKVDKEEKKAEGKYFRREIMRGEFQRTLSLPDNVDNENVSASFKDGILKVVIPKTEPTKRKAVEIK